MLDWVSMLSGYRIIREETPVGEFQSNGDVECTVALIHRMYRTVKSNLVTNYGQKGDPAHLALVWKVRYASLLMFGYAKGSVGQRIAG